MVMRASRLSILSGTLIYVILMAVLILRDNPSYWRTMVDLWVDTVSDQSLLAFLTLSTSVVFVWIFLVISFVRERSDRGLSDLRNQLRLQYKVTQNAQIAERKAHSARKRFSNYIFHEVRGK